MPNDRPDWWTSTAVDPLEAGSTGYRDVDTSVVGVALQPDAALSVRLAAGVYQIHAVTFVSLPIGTGIRSGAACSGPCVPRLVAEIHNGGDVRSSAYLDDLASFVEHASAGSGKHRALLDGTVSLSTECVFSITIGQRTEPTDPITVLAGSFIAATRIR